MDDALYDLDVPSNPEDELPFEVEAEEQNWSFTPYYYPNRFPQKRERELNRVGQQSGGEGVTVKKSKNPDLHIAGIVLGDEVGDFKRLRDYNGEVSVYSPLNPTGGIQCIVKGGEVDANPHGYDPVLKQRQFKYTIDLVSTGFDEAGRSDNQIVSAIVGQGNKGTATDGDDLTQPFN
jgi:hypothetical protein